jgi:serine/threonine protein kinase
MPTKFCTKCQQTFTTTQTTCPHDQTVLSLPDPYQMIGRTLLDKYQVEALVGLGGMGAVYCAYHTGLDRRVALKILQPNIALADEHLVELFAREAKVAGRLTHENIVDVKDAGRTPDGIAYIVMEWLEGSTLDEELREQGALSFRRTGEILRQIATALAEAHSKHVVHRDLKPANVMLVRRADGSKLGREVVKVLDFGIGKILTETGASVSAVMGTPSYASPEQLQLGGKIDGRSDIYSLGVILYRMLTGQLPFQSNSLPELVQMQLATIPTVLRAARPETPVAIDELVMQMLAKDQQLRPADALEVMQRYDAALAEINEAETINWTAQAATLLQDNTPRNAQPILQRTESLPNAPTPRRFEVKAAQTAATQVASAEATGLQTGPPAAKRHSTLLPGVVLGVLLAGGGFALYRSGFDAGANSRKGGDPTPAPQTGSSGPSPEMRAANLETSPKPRATVKAKTPSPTPPMVPLPPEYWQRPPDGRYGPPPGERPGGRPPKEPRDFPIIVTEKEQRERLSQVSQQQLGQARRFYERGDYKSALRSCEIALKLDPQNAEAATLKKKIQDALKILEER